MRRLRTACGAALAAVVITCSAAAAAPTTGHWITGNDGERIEYFTHGDPANPSLILTESGIGYRLVAPAGS